MCLWEPFFFNRMGNVSAFIGSETKLDKYTRIHIKKISRDAKQRNYT